MKLSNQDIGEAVDTAWPWIARSIQCSAREHSEEEILDLKEEVKDMKNKINDLEDVLVHQCTKNKKLKDTVCDLERELEPYQKT